MQWIELHACSECVFNLTDQCSHLFQQRVSCLPIGASGFRHTGVLLLFSVTLKNTETFTHLDVCVCVGMNQCLCRV